MKTYIYSTHFYESIVVFRINRKKTFKNKLVKNDGLDHKIEDLTWTGNSIHIKNFKKITGKLKFDPNGIRTYSEEYFNYSSVGGSDNLIAGINDGNENPSTSGLLINVWNPIQAPKEKPTIQQDLKSSFFF